MKCTRRISSTTNVKEGESIDSYVAALRQAAKACLFPRRGKNKSHTITCHILTNLLTYSGQPLVIGLVVMVKIKEAKTGLFDGTACTFA